MKRLRLIPIITIVLLAGWFAVQLVRNREPRYEGRTLTEWLMDFKDEGFIPPGLTNSPGMSREAISAVRHIGTNAIPVLLKKLTAHDNALVGCLKSWSLVKPGSVEPLLAFRGFCTLGGEARGAVPALANLIKHPDAITRQCALLSLERIHPDRETLVPILLAAIKDPDAYVRTTAVEVLARECPEDAKKAGVYPTVPKMKPSRTNIGSTITTKANK